MELTNEFVVDRPIDETWKIMNDLEFIAPCMPGAQLTEIEGDEYRGLVKIKVGPVTAKYKGKASFISQDAETHVAKLAAEGRDPRNGNANATITATMVENEGATTVTIHTDLALVGKIASFGRGAIEDVSKKLLGMFADNLAEKLANDGKEEVAEEAASDGTSSDGASSDSASSDGASDVATNAAAASTGSTSESSSTEDAPPAEPKVRKIDSAEPEPVDILAVTGDSVLKRLAPVLGGVVVLLILRMLLSGKSSD